MKCLILYMTTKKLRSFCSYSSDFAPRSLNNASKTSILDERRKFVVGVQLIPMDKRYDNVLHFTLTWP